MVRDDLTDMARIALQLIENLHRDDLTPTQEATQLLRAVGIGHTVKSLAAAVGRSQKWVKERLTIAELPATARKRIDQGNWTIADGIAAAKLIDRPERFGELLELPNWQSVEQGVQRILAEEGFTTAAVKLIEHAQAKGITVVDPDTPNVHRLDLIGLDPEAHQSEPCHAVMLQGRPPSAPRLVEVCTNRSSHNRRGVSDIKLPPPTGKLSDEQRAANAIEREARQARLDAMATAATAKLPKAEHVALIERSLLRTVSADNAKAALRLLGADTPKNGYTPQVLAEWAEATPSQMAQAVRAIALVEHNNYAHRAWGTDAEKTRKIWQRWLANHTGWKPTKWDKDQLK